jgi:hypothetical protein
VKVHAGRYLAPKRALLTVVGSNIKAIDASGVEPHAIHWPGSCARSHRTGSTPHAFKSSALILRSPALDELVRRLVRQEAGGSTDPESLAAAVEGACRKLSGELETLVGRGGVAALIGRAVNLAKREFPFLGVVRLEPDPPVALGGLRESLQGRDPAEAEAASVALLASLLGVLVNLLGEELGLRPVWNVWPSASPGAAPPTSRETGE